MFGCLSTSTAGSLQVHPGQASQALKSPLNKGQSIVPPSPVEDDDSLFFSTSSSPSCLKLKVTAQPTNLRVKHAMMPPLPPTPLLTSLSSSTYTTTISMLATLTSLLCNVPVLSSTICTERKPTPPPVTAPYPKHGISPLCMTKVAKAGSFGCLTPPPMLKCQSKPF